MKVNELREIIKKYDEKEKEKIIVELYKRIPKNIKEDYNIDNYITNLNTRVQKGNTNITIEKLEKEINYFMDCVNSDLYIKPNKIISKSERSKWRFKVKIFYKQLNSFSAITEDGKKATDLLKELFVILSFGTHYLTFSSWNTFGAIQVSQSEFLRNIIERKLINGITKENLSYCVELLNVKYDPQDYYRTLIFSFESCLKTTDAKYIAIDLLKEQTECWKEKYKKENSFENKEYVNYFVECIVYIYFNLCEVQEGIKYFHKQYIQEDKEVKEYILLEMLEELELFKEWILEYEKNIKKIAYRESLKMKYTNIKLNT